MTLLDPGAHKEALVHRGDEIYERDIRPLVEAEHKGRFVAIDVGTGDWEMDDDDCSATERLLARRPHAEMYLVRVGSRTAYRFGGPRRTSGTT